MVTFIAGEPDKSLYRHYKVTEGKKNDDVGSLKSVLEKRKYRFDSWGVPDLIIIDGGKGQLSGAIEVLGDSVPVVGLAKRLETLIFKTNDGFAEYVLPDAPAKKLVQRLRNEAHRFARSYHHKLVSRAIRES
jgi:excinuclease ABC subunit C